MVTIIMSREYYGVRSIMMLLMIIALSASYFWHFLFGVQYSVALSRAYVAKSVS